MVTYLQERVACWKNLHRVLLVPSSLGPAHLAKYIHDVYYCLFSLLCRLQYIPPLYAGPPKTLSKSPTLEAPRSLVRCHYWLTYFGPTTRQRISTRLPTRNSTNTWGTGSTLQLKLGYNKFPPAFCRLVQSLFPTYGVAGLLIGCSIWIAACAGWCSRWQQWLSAVTAADTARQ